MTTKTNTNDRRPLIEADAKPQKNDALAEHIIETSCPDPREVDFWAVGVFGQDPDDHERLIRYFAVFGKLKDCAYAVAGYLGRNHQTVGSTQTKIMTFQGKRVLWFLGDCIKNGVPVAPCKAKEAK